MHIISDIENENETKVDNKENIVKAESYNCF